MTTTTYFQDPECLIEFAMILNYDSIPKRFRQVIYDELWAYWGKHCCNMKDHTLRNKAVEIIKQRQKGWCSQADLRDAGFIPMDGRPMVPEAVVKEVVTRIINSECPC